MERYYVEKVLEYQKVFKYIMLNVLLVSSANKGT